MQLEYLEYATRYVDSISPDPATKDVLARCIFFFNDTATTEIYTTYDTLSLHDALPIYFMKPDRVVIGATSQRAIDHMRELYEPFVRTGNPILVMDNASAEMTKYAANALLATRISFMNEIANLCERVGADVDQVRRGIGYDRRIGHHFLFPGAGYGGSCFPKDVKAVIRTAREQGLAFPVLAAVEAVNEEQKRRLVDKVIAHFGSTL